MASAGSSSSTILLVLCFSFSVQVLVQGAVVKLPPGVRVPAVIVFGDSIVDPGNNNHLATLIKCNFRPYGRDFMGGNAPTGRFSNGKIPTDLIASLLGIKDLLPAYLDPFLQPDELLTGVSFASGGAGYDPLTAKVVTVLGLSDQLEMFKGYLGKLRSLAKEDKAQSIISESLYLIVCGSDDIANTYFASTFRKSDYDVPAYTDLMVQGASSFIQELYGLGARRIGVFSAPPIGCVPASRTVGGGNQRDCAENYNEAAQLFNSKLSSLLENLSSTTPQLRAVYIDIYNPLADIIKNPGSKGFKEAARGCCGTGNIETTFLCTELTPFTCEDAENYVFWDGYHPTEKAYEVLLGPIVEKYISSFV